MFLLRTFKINILSLGECNAFISLVVVCSLFRSVCHSDNSPSSIQQNAEIRTSSDFGVLPFVPFPDVYLKPNVRTMNFQFHQPRPFYIQEKILLNIKRSRLVELVRIADVGVARTCLKLGPRVLVWISAFSRFRTFGFRHLTVVQKPAKSNLNP